MPKNNGGGGNRGGGGGNNGGGGGGGNRGGGGGNGGGGGGGGGGAKAAAAAPVFQTNAGANPMGAPAKGNTPSGTSKGSGGAPVNQQIQRQLGSAGNTVNYKEAAAVAAKLGVSVDRVFNQTAKTGQGAKIGAAAYEAGYQPGENAKVIPTMGTSYFQAQYTDSLAQQQQAFNQQLTDLQSQYATPEFDWDAWNTQMMAQQAAVWESMDAMNSEFLRQQQEYLAQQSSQGQQAPGRNLFASSGGSPDKAAVKRRKQAKSQAGVKTNTGVNTSSANTGAAGSGLSLGGASGLAIGNNK